MKERADLVSGLLRKAKSDMIALDATMEAEAYDASEKFLKAFLANAGVEFPFTHNLARLVELCVGVDSSFSSLFPIVEALTPYAVQLRYDTEFWPTEDDVGEAKTQADTVKDFVLSRLR